MEAPITRTMRTASGRPSQQPDRSQQQRLDHVCRQDLPAAGAATLQHRDLVAIAVDDQLRQHRHEQQQQQRRGDLQERQGALQRGRAQQVGFEQRRDGEGEAHAGGRCQAHVVGVAPHHVRDVADRELVIVDGVVPVGACHVARLGLQEVAFERGEVDQIAGGQPGEPAEPERVTRVALGEHPYHRDPEAGDMPEQVVQLVGASELQFQLAERLRGHDHIVEVRAVSEGASAAGSNMRPWVMVTCRSRCSIASTRANTLVSPWSEDGCRTDNPCAVAASPRWWAPAAPAPGAR